VYTSTINAEFLNQQIKKISTTLTKGNTSTSVKILQEFLIAQNSGKASTALATYGANAHFGPLTRSALAEFQNKVGIYPSLGNFGPLTRAYIQSH
jgi:peptidoglycan hydrolase-like protein with peptidoglycan-binding domain